MGLRKREYIDRETIITAESMNEIQDAILDLEDGLFSVDNDKSGEVITITDAAKRGFRSLNIFGKTTQDGTPTPDAPVDLVSVGDVGSISVTVAEKNLWNGKFENLAFGSSEETNSIVTILSYPTYKSLVVPVIPGGKYSFSRGDAFWDRMFIAFTHNYPTIHTKLIFEDGNTTTFLNPYNKGTALVVSGITVPDDCYYMVVYLTNDSDTYDVTNTWYQVEVGETATGYEAPNGQTLTISTPNGLPGIPVTSGGNYTDADGQQWVCDEVNLGRGVYTRRILKTISDGSTQFQYQSVNANGIANFYCTLPYKVRNDISLSSSLTKQNTTIADTSGEGYMISNSTSTSTLYIRVSQERASTVGEFNALLVDNPVEFLFALETPIETPLSAEELAAYAALHTYKGNTTVSNDAGAWMELEYVMDAKKYIDSLVGSSGTILPARVE